MSIIYDFLKKDRGTYKSSEISGKTGVEKAIVDKEIKELVKEGLVDSPKRCFYKAK